MDEIRNFGRIAMGVALSAPDKLADSYTALGTRVHKHGEPKDDDVLADALQAVGLDVALLERTVGEEFDHELAASTRQALELVGDDVGVPIISVAGTAFFGPAAFSSTSRGTTWILCAIRAGEDARPRRGQPRLRRDRGRRVP